MLRQFNKPSSNPSKKVVLTKILLDFDLDPILIKQLATGFYGQNIRALEKYYVYIDGLLAYTKLLILRSYFDSCILETSYFDLDGNLHRVGKPAETEHCFVNGQKYGLLTAGFSIHGEEPFGPEGSILICYHPRDDGKQGNPKSIKRWRNGEIEKEEFPFSETDLGEDIVDSGEYFLPLVNLADAISYVKNEDGYDSDFVDDEELVLQYDPNFKKDLIFFGNEFSEEEDFQGSFDISEIDLDLEDDLEAFEDIEAFEDDLEAFEDIEDTDPIFETEINEQREVMLAFAQQMEIDEYFLATA